MAQHFISHQKFTEKTLHHPPLQTWWELWDLHNTLEWAFYSLVLMLIAPAGLYLIAHLIFPEPMKNSNFRGTDKLTLKPHRKWVYGISYIHETLRKWENQIVEEHKTNGLCNADP